MMVNFASDMKVLTILSGFYRKYSGLRQWKMQSENETMSATSTGQALKDESETMRNAVILFHDYYQKQQAAQKAKIEKDRDSLPITKYEKAIVHTLRKHRVMLIAGDTGCGKSTQGRRC
jgi:ATP-dependent RNA helicase DHX34